jgi:predicted PurR-regulated permease PerM
MDKDGSPKISDQPSTQMIFRYFLVIFLITIFFVGRVLWPFLSILVLAFVLTGTFYPIYRFLTKKMAPTLSSLVTCSVIFLVVFVPLVFLVGALSQEAYDLYLLGTDAAANQDLRELFQNNKAVDRLEAILQKYDINLSTEDLNRVLSQLGRTIGLFLYQQVGTIASNVLKFVVNFLFMLLVIFFCSSMAKN